MATQGPLYPGTVTTEVGPSGDNDWTNPSNIGADDGTEAQITAATYDAGDHSYRLKAQNFGFTIPSDATINGIVVEIDRRDFAGDAQDQEVRLYDASGTLVGDDKQDSVSWPATLTVATYGSSSDTWAASPTPAMVNDPDFGVALIVLANSANTDIAVDFIRVTVHYTPNPNIVVTPPAATLTLTGAAPFVKVYTAYSDKVESYLPTMYWPLGERSGTTAFDERSGAHDGTYENTPTLGDTGIGDGGTAVTLSADRVSIPDHALLDFTSPFSIMAWVKQTGVNAFDNAIWGKGTGGVPYLFVTGSSQSPAGRVSLSKSDTADNVQTGALITDSAWHCIIAVYEHNVIGKIYVDGVDSGGTPSYNAFSTNAIAAGIGSKTGAAQDGAWAGSIAHVAIFDYALNATEAADLSTTTISDPNVTITPPAAVLTLTGAVPTVSTPVTVTPPAATLTLTAAVPTVSTPVVVTPPAATLTLTAAIPTVAVTNNVRLEIPAAVLTLSGAAPSVVAPVTVTPPAAVLTLTGQVPEVSVTTGEDITITPDAAVLTLTGVAPSVLTPRTVTPPAATLTLTGAAPSVLTPRTVTPPAAVLTLTGAVPTVTATANVLIEVPAAVLILTAHAPTVIGDAIIPEQAEPVAVDEGGRGPRGITPFDDWTLAMDDEAILEMALLEGIG